MPILGARVLISDKCAAILKEHKEKIKKQQEKERRKLEREQKKKDKEEQQRKKKNTAAEKKTLAIAKKVEKEAKKDKVGENQGGSKVNGKLQNDDGYATRKNFQD